MSDASVLVVIRTDPETSHRANEAVRIALGILAASEQLPAALDNALAFGEVALDGRLRRTHGILPVAVAARMHGFGRVIVPAANAWLQSQSETFWSLRVPRPWNMCSTSSERTVRT